MTSGAVPQPFALVVRYWQRLPWVTVSKDPNPSFPLDMPQTGDKDAPSV